MMMMMKNAIPPRDPPIIRACQMIHIVSPVTLCECNKSACTTKVFPGDSWDTPPVDGELDGRDKVVILPMLGVLAVNGDESVPRDAPSMEPCWMMSVVGPNSTSVVDELYER